LTFLALTTDFDAAWMAFKGVNILAFVAVALGAALGSYLIDTLSLRFILRAVGIKVGFFEFLKVKGASYLLNIINYNLALVLMAAVVKRRTERGWASSGSPFVMLNFIDLTVFGGLTVGAIIAGASPFEDVTTRIVGLIALGGFLAGPSLMAITRIKKGPAWLLKIVNHNLLEAFARISFGNMLLAILARSMLVLLYAVMNHLFLGLYGADVSIPNLLVYMPILSIVGFIPISISGLGSTQVLARRFYGPHVTTVTGESAQFGVIDAFSTTSILTIMLLRVVVGLICTPFVTKMLADSPKEQQ